MSVWEKRYNPLLDEWVIIAAHTGDRPWSGETFDKASQPLPEFDPSCYLCPGVTRAKGSPNPQYTDVYAFTNDFGSLSADAPHADNYSGLYQAKSAKGICRVICFSPRHNITLPQLPPAQLEKVIELWQKEYRELSLYTWIKNILIFENKGKIIGVSNPHPHGQIYATDFVPSILERELLNAKNYHHHHGQCLFCDIMKEEKSYEKRIVYQNDGFIVFVPYFAKLKYQTFLLPKRHINNILEMDPAESKLLADALNNIICRYDNLYRMNFPNILMMHNMPLGSHAEKHFHFHIEFYPPLRTPIMQKYMAGFESGGGNIINPSDPDQSALELQNCPPAHYALADTENTKGKA
jgi:UDPglucose--hexose-1-phosphate uridylyltransferase